MASLIWELICEDLPIWAQRSACEQFRCSILDVLQDWGLNYESLNVYATPRRIAVLIEGMDEQTKVGNVRVVGPAIDHELAISAFCKAHGVDIQNLTQEKVNNRDCWIWHKEIPSANTIDRIPELCDKAVASVRWKQSMHWGNNTTLWPRPVRNIMCVFSEKHVDWSWNLGCDILKSADYTFGHRFLSDRDMIKPNSVDDYIKKLRDSYVLLLPKEREEVVTKALGNVDQKWIDKAIAVCEFPVASVLDGFDLGDVPREMVEVMLLTHHTALLLADNRITFVLDREISDDIEAGLRHTVECRLQDLQTFWDECVLNPNSHRCFFEELGTIKDKTDRMIRVAMSFGDADLADACKWSKSDLDTKLVNEFPDLQGRVAMEIANRDKDFGIPREVARAIGEHYWPRGYAARFDLEDLSDLGKKLAIIDNLDTIVGLWITGKRPKGSKDPFAIRQSAIAVIRMLAYAPWSLDDLVHRLFERHSCRGALEFEAFWLEFSDFMRERMVFVAKTDWNIDRKLAEATILWNVSEWKEGLFLLSEIISASPDFLKTMRRVNNLISDTEDGAVDPKHFVVDHEKRVWDMLESDRPGDYVSYVKSLIDCVVIFCDEVSVLGGDPVTSRNRIALLHDVMKNLRCLRIANLLK